MKGDIERSPEEIRILLHSHDGTSAWFTVHPSSEVRRLFTDKVLVRQPGKRTRLHQLVGGKVKVRDPSETDSL